uniref:DNA topoisomerase (ATP-hydrolyzing) n=1 Tax=Plectus sambesii TaxID=2011161 RepID=A0A914WM72_9BILA
MAAENEKYVSTALEQVVLRKVEEFLENFLNQLKSNEEASSKQQGILLSIPSVAEEGFRLSISSHTKMRCAFVIRVLAEVYGLIVSGKYSTKRDIFYQNKALFGKQSNLNRAVTTVCQLLNEPRVNLHLLSTARGCIFGDLQFINEVGTEIDCRQHPVLISSHFESIEQVKSDARFVLVVEKDATFVKLCDEKLVDLLGPCIMITGKGYPDISTRRVLKALLQHLHGVPVLGLMDSDPHGLEILLTYKFGAQKATAENRNLGVNDIRWIGLHRSDISSMPIMPDQFLPLQASDIRKIGKIQKRIYRLKEDMLGGESGASLEEVDQMIAE